VDPTSLNETDNLRLIFVLMLKDLVRTKGYIGRRGAAMPERIIHLCMHWVTKSVNRVGVEGTDTAASLGAGPMTWEAVGARTLVGVRIQLGVMLVVVLGLTFMRVPRGRGDPLRATLRNHLLHRVINGLPMTAHGQCATEAAAPRCQQSAPPVAPPVLVDLAEEEMGCMLMKVPTGYSHGRRSPRGSTCHTSSMRTVSRTTARTCWRQPSGGEWVQLSARGQLTLHGRLPTTRRSSPEACMEFVGGLCLGRRASAPNRTTSLSLLAPLPRLPQFEGSELSLGRREMIGSAVRKSDWTPGTPTCAGRWTTTPRELVSAARNVFMRSQGKVQQSACPL
jgi:hypothetical protein